MSEIPIVSAPPDLSPRERAEGQEAVGYQQKRLRTKPAKADLVKLPGATYDAKTDTITVPGTQRAAVDEMLRTHRGLEAERGATLAGRRPRPRLLRHRDGRIATCSEQNAERVAKFTGATEVVSWSTRTAGYAVDDEGYLSFRGEPTGHTHIGEPLPWVAETCRGCLAEKEDEHGDARHDS